MKKVERMRRYRGQGGGREEGLLGVFPHYKGVNEKFELKTTNDAGGVLLVMVISSS